MHEMIDGTGDVIYVKKSDIEGAVNNCYEPTGVKKRAAQVNGSRPKKRRTPTVWRSHRNYLQILFLSLPPHSRQLWMTLRKQNIHANRRMSNY